MRFMILVKATKDSEAGVMPKPELLQAMGKFNQSLIDAGVLLAGDGLQASAKGARIGFGGGEPTVTKGPFDIAGMVSGYWIWKTASLDEAIEWARKAPMPAPGELEIRQIFEMEDFA